MKPNKSVFMSKTDFYKAIYDIVNEIPEGCVDVVKHLWEEIKPIR